MRWFLAVLILILLGCAQAPPEKLGETEMGSRFRKRRFVGQNPTEPGFVVPLAGTWELGGYWDFRQYDLEDGAQCPNPLIPQEGHVNIIPLNAQNAIISATGLAGRRALRLTPDGGANHPALTADPLAALMAGSDKPLSIVMRVQREIAASYRLASFGNSVNATNDFFDGFIAASGIPAIIKDAIAEASVLQSATTNVQFVDVVIAWVTDGTQCWIYIAHPTSAGIALEPGFPLPLNTLPLTCNEFTFGTQRRVSPASPFQGLIANMAITPQILTLGQLQTLNAAWLAEDAPVTPGQPAMFLGDSITMGSMSTFNNGFRKAIWEQVVANGWNVNFVGTNFNGNFPDNEHCGLSGRTIGNIDGFITTIFGAGKPFNGTKFTMLLIGTNNMGQGATPFSNPGTMNEYADLLEDLTALEPTMKIGVTTIPAIDPAIYPGPSANVNTFNAALPAIWTAFNTAHPGILLNSCDFNAALGGPVYAPANFSADGVHPNDPGYANGANCYLSAYGATFAAM